MKDNPLKKTPVLFLVFNRPDTTKQVFEAIRKARPTSLYIAADGPRVNTPGDEEKCRRVREIVSNIDWPCEVHKLFREKNLGCRAAVSSAIDWFFKNVEQGIILEDDCLPDQTFFPFCEELLEKYKNNDSIMQISGNNFQQNNANLKCEGSYYFSRIPLIWGWASWRRAWNMYDLQMKKWPEVKKDKTLIPFFKNRGVYEYWSKTFDKYYMNRIDTWDGQWFFACAVNGGICISPRYALVTNIGFGKDSVHQNDSSHWSAHIQTHPMSFPLIHPKNISINYSADNFAFRDFFNIDKKLYHRLVRPLKTAFPEPYKKIRNLLKKKIPSTKNTETIFTEIFKNNGWHGKDSISGTGSDTEQTKALVEKLPVLFGDLKIHSILDIPCGDFHWMQKVDLNEIKYIGADIVGKIIEQDKKLYGKENIHFTKLDLIKDDLPKTDIILCRDCLVHLSFDDISKALKNICKSGSTYLLTTTFTEHKKNEDIRTGKWRTLNLAVPPFNFPPPVKIINEECTEGDGQYSDKSLGLWEISEIAKLLK